MEKYTFQDFMNMFLHNEVPLETIDIITKPFVCNTERLKKK